MSNSLADDGWKIHRKVIERAEIHRLRNAASSVAAIAGTACVRHLRNRSECFDALSVSDPILSLLPSRFRPVRSILFDKTATENWPALWHQDLTIAVAEKHPVPGYGSWSHKDGAAHVQPPIPLLEKMITVRLHLDETPRDNGALRVIPGSHRSGRISSHEVAGYDTDLAIDCECAPGDVLLMSPLILHSSRRAVNPQRRRVLHFEYARPEDLHPDLEWFERETNKERTRHDYQQATRCESKVHDTSNINPEAGTHFQAACDSILASCIKE